VKHERVKLSRKNERKGKPSCSEESHVGKNKTRFQVQCSIFRSDQ